MNKLNSSAVAAGRTRSKLDMVAAPSGSSSRLGSGDSVEEAPQAATSAAAAPKPLNQLFQRRRERATCGRDGIPTRRSA